MRIFMETSVVESFFQSLFDHMKPPGKETFWNQIY